MKIQYRRRIASALLIIALLVSGSAWAETATWDCLDCGRTGNTGNFCGSCGHPRPEPETVVPAAYDITVWVSESAVDLTRKQIEDFNRNNTYGLTFSATVQAVSEGNAAEEMLRNVAAGGDLYCFAQDQLARLVKNGALTKLDDRSITVVSVSNDAGSVAAASSGKDLYAFPMTADNGYFMYYDKSVIPESDVGSLEKLIADCEAARKYFAFEMQTSAWYMASFFFATGCTSEWTADSAGNFISVHDTFNSPEGLIALKGMKKLLDSDCHINSSRADEFGAGAAVVVSGTWDYVTAKSYLGSNLGAAALPSFTVEGNTYHLGSYNGCKLMGIKPQSDAGKSAALQRLAQYLTGEKAQMERFEALAWGPSNLQAQQSGTVQANAGLAALLAQAPYSVPLRPIHPSWWDAAREIAAEAGNATNDAGLQKALDHYRDKIAAVARIE